MIYVHVPFCRSFCTYCGFYSEICSRRGPQQVQNRIMEDYADALLDEIASRCEEITAARGSGPAGESPSPDTLYIGGGTPSVLPPVLLERIVRALGPATYEEFTVEVNPDDVAAGGAQYAAALRALGVNRVSMGVQSFDDGMLRWMNRRHDAAGAREAFRLLRAAGFDNISIDLIFGLSHLSDGLWEKTIAEALALRPEHISAYQLSVDADSALAEIVDDGRYTEASDEQCRRQYDTLCRLLADAGYVHYEISNWALPGREAVHNSAYWRRVPYIGLGPSAHSLSFSSAPITVSAFSSAHSLSSLSFPSAPSASPFAPSASPFAPSASSAPSTPSVSSSAHGAAPTTSSVFFSASIDVDDSPVAASCNGVRSWNTSELARRDAAGKLLRWHAEREILSEREAAEETIMLALRTARGLPLAQLRALSPAAPVDDLLASGALPPIPSASLPSSSVPSSSAPVSSAPSSSAPVSFFPASSAPSSSAPVSSVPSYSIPIPSASTSSAPGFPRVRIPEDRFFVSDDIISRLFPAG